MDDFLDQMVSSSPFNIEWAGMSRLLCDLVDENEAMNAMEAIPCDSMEMPIEDIGQLVLQNQSEEFPGIPRDFPSSANYLSQVPISLCPPYLSQSVPIKEGDGFIKEETFGFQQQIFGIPSDSSKKRTLEDEDQIMISQESLFNSSAYAQLRDVTTSTGKMNQNYVNFEDFKEQSGVSQHQTNSVVTEVKPRTRARRGQATEPHSIQERLRRKRIAAKMKALQELVPCSNKTDKASMLEECIDYMKLLQLQLKIASMSRLGGASVIAPIISIPSEGEDWSHNSMDVAVHKVARLMEEDMDGARKFLESKGVCLIPISMARSIQGGLHGSSVDGSVVNTSPPM